MDYWLRENRRRNINEPSHVHALTFTCYHRFRFLSAERTCVWLADAIERAREIHGFALWAYVFTPEHAHLLIQPSGTDAGIAAILQSIKQPVGQRAIAYLRSHAPTWLPRIVRIRGNRTEHLFWQSGGGFDRNITESKALEASVEYIHQNPVRRGLVVLSKDWRWSSAGWFHGEEPNALKPDRIPWEWLL